MEGLVGGASLLHLGGGRGLREPHGGLLSRGEHYALGRHDGSGPALEQAALVHPHHAVAAQKVVEVAVVAVAVGVVRVVKIAVVKPSLYHRSWLRTNERQTEKLEQFFVE